jgi:hypothetical protein
VRSAAGVSARRRRRGPKGQRKAADARRGTVPFDGQPVLRRHAVSGCLARYPGAVASPARRAPRALEDVEKVVTGRCPVRLSCPARCQLCLYQLCRHEANARHRSGPDVVHLDAERDHRGITQANVTGARYLQSVTEPTAESERDAERRMQIHLELQRLEENSMYSAQTQFEHAKQWRAVNLILGLPASVLAALAGATALASTAGRIVAGVLALAAAGFGAILTTINASHRTNQASAAANAYLEIQGAARQARTVDLPYETVEEARAALAELTARRDEQNRTAEVPSRRAYKKAKRNIESGSQSYSVDRITSE